MAQADITNDNKPGAVFIHVLVDGQPAFGLLDTGCELSVMGRNICLLLALKTKERKLYAANGMAVPLLGEADVGIRVGRQSHTWRILVSESLSDLVLGVDWLTFNKCQWDFHL